MQFPDRDKLQKLLHKEKEVSRFGSQEKRVAALIARCLSLLGSGKFIEAIDEYYNAWNFFESFRAQEPVSEAAALSAQLRSVHERIFKEIAREIDICCAGDKYNKAMYLYETLRLFHDNARKYLDDSTHQTYFKRMQEIYNSMISI